MEGTGEGGIVGVRVGREVSSRAGAGVGNFVLLFFL